MFTMKVAVVYHFWPHYRYSVLRELDRDPDVDFHFFADFQDYVDKGVKPLTTHDTPIYRLRCVRLMRNWMWQRGVIRLCRRGDYDAFILLGDPHYLATWIGLVILRARRKPAWLWTHGWTEEDAGTPRGLVRLAFYRLAYGLMLYGHYAKNYGIARGLRPDRLQVVHNSISHVLPVEPDASPSPDRDDVGETAPFRLIFVGRVTSRSRLDLALLAMKQLEISGCRCRLTIVGQGPAKPDLMRQSVLLGVDVSFVDETYDATELFTLFRDADCGVSPGGVGLFAILCLAHGVPLVTHGDWSGQRPEFESVVEGRTGLLFERDNVVDLARAIAEAVPLSRCPETEIQCRQQVGRLFSPDFQANAISFAVRAGRADDLWFAAGNERKWQST